MKFTHRLHSLPSLGLFLFLAVGMFWGGSAQAALPNVGAVSTLTGQVANSSTSITFASFSAASTASDPDPGDTISYRINAVTTGTLTKGGVAVVAGTTTFAAGETLVWTPPANQTGDLLAFTVKALAGGEVSTGTAQVTVRVPGPVFTNLSVISGGAEDANTVITYNELDSAGNATASSAISYRIESVISGTLTKNGLAVEPGATTIGNGEQLIWLPPANENGTLRAFTVRAMAAGIASATALEARITTSPVPDAPTISGTVLAAINDDAAATALFSSVVVADVDDGHPNPETVVLSVRVPQTAGEMGVFNFGDASLQNSGSDYIYTFPAKSPAAATAALAAVTFDPLPNLQPGGQTQGFTVVVSVKDSTNLSALSNLSGGTTITAIDDPPVLTLVANPSTILDFGTFHPFTLTVADPDPTDDVNKTLNLTLVEDAPARGTITGGTISGNSAQLAAAIQSVTYQPFATEGSVTGHFHLTNGAGLISPTADLIVSNQNDAPTISGITTALLHTTDDLSQPLIHPFATVTISDPDFASPGVRQTLTATITLDDPSRGSTNPATLTGTAAELTTLIRALTFAPTPNRVAVGSSETTALTLTVSDGSLSSSNGQTRIATLSVNGAPSIQGVPLSQPVKFSPPTIVQPLTPFAGLSVNDDDAVPQVTLKISLDNAAKGNLGNLGLFVPTAANSGIYRISTLSSISAVNSALQGLTFIPDPNFAFPPNQPGLTTFTLEVADVLQNRTTAIMSIVLENRARNFLVSLREDNSLKRPGSLRHAVEQALDNDVITFALTEYPAVVRLDPTLGPLLLRHHLQLKGPGADLLSISGDFDGNGFPDGQLFSVEANVSMEGLTLTQGMATTGGAIHVGLNSSQPSNPAGSLTMTNCSVTDCRATQWGGAIDVEEGALAMDHCLLKGNMTEVASGLGGGAISLYTSLPCSVVSTTFSGNRQRATSGYGGGAIYAENFDPQRLFNVEVTHCTFAENEDASNQGSSITANVFNARVVTRGSLFADASQRNLFVTGSGQIISQGRNLSNDATRTTLLQGGIPQSVVLLNQSTDKVSTNPLLQPLARGIGGMEGYALSPLSPALGSVLVNEGTDQRGVWRSDGLPDTGALEYSATKRIIINEIMSDPAVSGNGFIEFYIPRDSAPVQVGGMQVFVNNKLRHTFTNAEFQPGFGLVLVEPTSTVPHDATADHAFWDAADDPQRSIIELRTASNKVLDRVNYVNVFKNLAVPSQTFINNSITLAPQFRGDAFVPNSIGQAPPLGPLLTHGGPASSPGADTGGTPFGLDNAFPFAAADTFVVNEDDLVKLPVLANDSDADGLDKLVLVNVSPTSAPAGNAASALSQLGASVTLTPTATPVHATDLWYGPRISQNHLSAGVSATDSFFYTIVDLGSGPISSYATDGAATLITSPGHRLTTGEQIVISGAGAAAYNATFSVTKVSDNSFTIPLSFAGNPTTKGSWTTLNSRLTTQRSENKVTLTVMGRNDAPTPVSDTVSTNEEQILRIMGDPDLIASAPAFDTDPQYPGLRAFASSALLTNDTDPDDDDHNYKRLRLVGVTQARAVISYQGTAGQAPVTVRATGHGFTTGASVLISGYGGHSSYNAYHVVTVVDADTFTIPIPFVDDDTVKGYCGILNPQARLQTTSLLGAAVNLEIRTSRLETNIVYNPHTSTTINQLSQGEPITDSFFYVVEDTHGADAFCRVNVNVTGVNDIPVPQQDPASLAQLNALVSGGTTLRDVVAATKVLYSLPGAAPGRCDVTVQAGETTYVLTDVPHTTEDAKLGIPTAFLLSNDSDVDINADGSENMRPDVLRVTLAPGQTTSREGATVKLENVSGIPTLIYDPSNPAVSPRLNALAREERILDTVAVTISDGLADVVSVLAIEVTGRNDQPTARPDVATIPEDQLLTLGPPSVLINDTDPDQDTHLNDDRKVLIPVTNAGTTVFGTLINTSVTPASGNISSFAAASGNAAVTLVNAPEHGLQTGEEIIISNTAVPAYNGQFPITRITADSFTIPLASSLGAASAGAGSWRSLRSTLTYDPRGSVFNFNGPGPTFTLDGLAQGQTYTDVWTYTMFDGSFVFANDDMFRVAADSIGVVLPVAANDVNLTGLTGPLNIIKVGIPSQRGTAVLNADNTITYTPETSFVGDEYFTYTVQDSYGNTDSALVTARVTVNQLNGNLQANRDYFTVAKGQSPLLSVLANDDILPATGATLSITRISTLPTAGGTAVIEGSGIRYTPAASAPSYPYSETFAYEISAGGTARAIATVAIQVANRQDTLPLRADVVSVQTDSLNNQLNVLANDNILPGSGLGLTITAAGTPLPGTVAHGTVTISTDGKRLLYAPNPSFVGTDRFRYTASDSLGGTGTTTVEVVVGALTTNNDFFTVSSLAPISTVELDVLANDRVVGSSGNVSIKSMANQTGTFGTLAVKGDGQKLLFTPLVGAVGEQTFAYQIEDGTGRQTAGSVTIFVSQAGLRANTDAFTVRAGSIGTPLAVLDNDISIPDLGQPKALASIGTGGDAPDHGGTVTINPTNSMVLYTPAADFVGEERFTYFVSNGDTTATAQVIVKVSDGSLVASDDWFSVYRGSSEMRLEVLANDRILPPTGQSLTITGIGIINNAPGRQGTVIPTNDNSALLYTPNPANITYPYTETFTYEISDGGSRRTQAIVHMEILDRVGSREMETNDDSFTVLAGSQNTLLSVLANDDIRPAAAIGWTISSVTTPNQGGTAVVNGLGIAYTPRLGFVGTETFSYSTADGLGGTGTATVTVKVGDVLVGDDIFNVLSGSLGNSLNVLANDGLFPDGFPNSANRPGLSGFTLSPALMIPNHGGTAVVSGGKILYSPSPVFVGTETFTYWVQDDSGIKFPGQVTVNVEQAGSDRSSAPLTITVTGVNDPPVMFGTTVNPINDKQTTRPFAGVTIRDVDDQLNELITVRISFPATRGTLSGAFNLVAPGVYQFIGNGAQATAAIRTLVYTPVENRITVAGTEETSFTVSLQDPFVTSPVINAGSKVAVAAVNDPPVLTGTVAGQRVYLHSTIAPFEGVNLTDVDDLSLQIQTVVITIDNPSKGTLTTLGGFVEGPAGRYALTGTPAQVSATMRGMVFNPTPGGRVTPGNPETSRFTITVNDGFAPTLTDTITSVVVLHPLEKKLLPLTNAGVDASQTEASYGSDVSVSGDTLVVGAEHRDNPLADSGAAYVYERNAGGPGNWGQVAILAPTDLAAGDFFGGTVCVKGDLIAIPADLQTVGGLADVGAVYIFQRDPLNRNAWNQVAKVTEPVGDRNTADEFGESLALFGTTLVVGAPYANQPRNDAGAVFIYEKDQGGPNAWGLKQKLLPSGVGEGATSDYFGITVALDGNTLAVAAYGVDRGSDPDLGAVYLFERPNAGGTFTQQKKVTLFNGPGASVGDFFGCDLDLSGNTLVVGACLYDRVVLATSLPAAGAAFVFERNQGGVSNWGLAKTLVSPSPAQGDWFGHSIAIAKDLIMVGAPKQNNSSHPTSLAGYACIYRRQEGGPENWGLLETIQPALPTQNDRFGFFSALDQFTAVLGAHEDKINASNAIGAGAAYALNEFKYNNAPTLIQPIPNQVATENASFSFPVPSATFSDADYADFLTYQATLSDGTAIPGTSWLRFNPATATFSGTPTPTNYRPLTLIVKATDEQGLSVTSNAFTISVAVDPVRTFNLAIEAWQRANFPASVLANPVLSASIYGSDANPDRDTYSNLLEMALGLEPNVANPPGLISVEASPPLITLVYPVANNFPAEFIHVEWSLDLNSWKQINVSTTVRTQLNTSRIMASSAYPPVPSGKIYLRLKVGP